jgi:tetrahydromethanopterin S-methyltransferase subunit G
LKEIKGAKDVTVTNDLGETLMYIDYLKGCDKSTYGEKRGSNSIPFSSPSVFVSESDFREIKKLSMGIVHKAESLVGSFNQLKEIKKQLDNYRVEFTSEQSKELNEYSEKLESLVESIYF